MVARRPGGRVALVKEFVPVVGEKLRPCVQRVSVVQVEIEAVDVVLEKEVTGLADTHVLFDPRLPGVVDEIEVRPSLIAWRDRNPGARSAAHQCAISARLGGNPRHARLHRQERWAGREGHVPAQDYTLPREQGLEPAVLHAVEPPLPRVAPAPQGR